MYLNVYLIIHDSIHCYCDYDWISQYHIQTHTTHYVNLWLDLILQQQQQQKKTCDWISTLGFTTGTWVYYVKLCTNHKFTHKLGVIRVDLSWEEVIWSLIKSTCISACIIGKMPHFSQLNLKFSHIKSCKIL